MVKVKKDAAQGQDGVDVEMMLADCLFEVWLALFQVCWDYGPVPSMEGEFSGSCANKAV